MGLNLRGDSTYSPYLSAEDTPPIVTDVYYGSAPVKKAVIIAAGNGSRLQGYQNGRPKPLLKVGGVHLLERVIRSAKKVGVTEFVIVIGYQAARIRKTLTARKLGVKITWVRNIDWRQPNGVSVLKAERYVDEKFFLCMSDHIFDYKILDKIKEVDLGQDAGMLCVDCNLTRVPNLDDATKVRTNNSRLVDLNKSLADFNAIDIGVFVCTPDLFDALKESQDAGDYSLSGGIRVLSEEGRMRTFDIGEGLWQDVDTIPDARHAERLLLRSTRSEGDGFIARHINRKVSNQITRWLLKTPITPNQISILNLLFSFLTAWVVSLGTPITTAIGGIMFQLASIFDGCDGEVAQIKLRDSKLGAKIDTVTDHLSYLSFVIGATVGVYNATGNSVVFLVTGIVIASLLFALNLARLYIKRKGTASLRALDTAIASLNHSGQQARHLKLFGIIHHLGRRDFFAFAAMLVMLLGNLQLLYWTMMLFLGLVSVGMSMSAAYFLSRTGGFLPVLKTNLFAQIKALFHE